MHYDYVPMPHRKPLKWPNGARLALMITFNLEYWDLVKDSAEPYYAGGPAILPDPLPGNVPDFPNYSWREYGQRVGIWRLIDIFDKAGVPATCTMNAKMGLERRAVIDAINQRGWELVAHNFVQSDLLTNYQFEPEKEREIIRETLRVYEQVVGRPAKGWLSSSLRSTTQTADICAELGLIYFNDLMNDDQPYLIQTKHGPIVSVPYTVEMNDFMIFLRRGMSTSEAVEVFKEQFDVLYAEGAGSGRLMSIGLHPHVIGQPFRVRAVREFIEYVKRFDGVWWAKREEIAEWYLQNHQSHVG
ncbi:MAG: polysaccharide deacetylase family protein [Deltaproteobacteria bacterium]|nr:polysaccharide deacetylase family protein [Deltaproteobacteria bacterium]